MRRLASRTSAKVGIRTRVLSVAVGGCRPPGNGPVGGVGVISSGNYGRAFAGTVKSCERFEFPGDCTPPVATPRPCWPRDEPHRAVPARCFADRDFFTYPLAGPLWTSARALSHA